MRGKRFVEMSELSPRLQVVTKMSGEISQAEKGSSQSQAQSRKIWKTALQKYYDELAKGGCKFHALNKDLWSIKDPEELLSRVRSIPGYGRAQEHDVLGEVLQKLSDFAAVVALASEMDDQVAAVLWGSIRILLVVG
jgi:hypothetical protein